MGWREHHERNAKVGRAAGTLLLFGGAVITALHVYYGWPARKELLMTLPGMVLPALLMLGVSGSQKRKARFFPRDRATAADREPPSGPDAILHRDSEMMLMRQSGMRHHIRYFSVDGDLLLEFRETSRGWVLWADGALDGLRSFLPKSFVVTDRIGTPRLRLQQRGGLNRPMEVYLPDGTKIASYLQDRWKAQMDIRDGAGCRIGELRSDDLLGTSFRITDASGREVIRFYNGGLPSRNMDAFSGGADLIKLRPQLAEDPEDDLRFIALPALLKVVFKR
ncbi:MULTISPECIES: hypothetical protein [Paenibacillus]|uniref:hypothetical protein n=1 Tax=Paenibacillus TaxID=44249 RepID=UPI0022B871BF|nr:hypothetical protein [Paenibacillus caseinilyticus]MCZ8522471.1 hypothetical protein [Paenibacillus caseinilyticus]